MEFLASSLIVSLEWERLFSFFFFPLPVALFLWHTVLACLVALHTPWFSRRRLSFFHHQPSPPSKASLRLNYASGSLSGFLAFPQTSARACWWVGRHLRPRPTATCSPAYFAFLLASLFPLYLALPFDVQSTFVATRFFRLYIQVIVHIPSCHPSSDFFSCASCEAFPFLHPATVPFSTRCPSFFPMSLFIAPKRCVRVSLPLFSLYPHPPESPHSFLRLFDCLFMHLSAPTWPCCLHIQRRMKSSFLRFLVLHTSFFVDDPPIVSFLFARCFPIQYASLQYIGKAPLNQLRRSELFCLGCLLVSPIPRALFQSVHVGHFLIFRCPATGTLYVVYLSAVCRFWF